MTPLYDAMLEGKDVSMSSFKEPLAKLILAKPCFQLSTCNLIIVLKTTSVITCSILSLCSWQKAFLKRYLCFFKFFFNGRLHAWWHWCIIGRWSMKLHEEDYPTIPLFTKSYMNLDNVLVIPHMIKKSTIFQGLINPYMLKRVDRLIGHTKV